MEDKIKNKLKGLEVKWDKEKLWDKLEPQLPQRKPNRKRYIGHLLLFLAVFILGQWSLKKGEEVQIKPTKNTIASRLNDIENKEEKIIIKPKEQTAFIPIKNSADTDQNSASTTDSSVLSQRIKGSEKEQLKTNKKEMPSSQQLSKSYENQLNGNSTVEEEQNGFKDAPPKNVLTIDNTTESNANLKNPQAPRTELDSKSVTSFKTLPPIAIERAFDKVQVVPFLSMALINLLPTNDRKDSVSVNASFLPSDKFPFFFFEIGTEIGKPLRKLSLKDSNDPIQVENQGYKNFESPLLRTSIEAKIGMLFKQGFYVSTGASLENFHEKLNWEKNLHSDTSFIADREKGFYVLNGDLDTTYFNGPGLTVKDSIRKVIHYNRVQYFIIPISFGYQKQWKRWTLGVSTGINFGFGSKFIGKSLRSDEAENAMITINPTMSITKAIGWQGKLTMSYLLDKKTSIKFSTGLKGHSQMEMNDLLLSYQTVSVGLGLRRLF